MKPVVAVAVLYAVLAASHPLADVGAGEGNGQVKLSDLGCGPGQIARVGASGAWACSPDLTSLEEQNLDARVNALEAGRRSVSFDLIDGNDQPIGDVLGLDGISSAIVKTTVIDNFGAPRDIIIQAGPVGIEGVLASTIYFETPDCTGQAYAVLGSELLALSKDSGFTRAMLFKSGDFLHVYENQLWLETNPTPVAISTQSKLVEANPFYDAPTCAALSATLDPAISIERVEPDFGTLHPGPYRIETH